MTQTNNQTPGEQYHPFEVEQRECPYPLYARMRKEEPIAYSPDLGAWLVTRYSDIRMVTSQPEIFSSREVIDPMAAFPPEVMEVLQQGYPSIPTSIESDPPQHQRFREPHRKALAAAEMVQHETFIRALANRLIDRFIEDRQADLIAQFASPLPLEVILHILGIPDKDMVQLQRWCEDQVNLRFAPLDIEGKVGCARGIIAYQQYMAKHITECMKNPGDDLIGLHISGQIPGGEPLSLHELISMFTGFTMVGHRTTVDLIGNGLALLLQERARWEKICEQPELIASVVEEVLRYESPIPAFYRTAVSEVTIGDVTLPAGARVILLFASANRDEDQFPDAEEFDLQRTQNRHLAFGFGPHFCPGAPLARMEARIALETLVQRLPGLRLVPNQQLEHVPVLVFRTLQRLEAEW